jgi:hypothetical protein
MQFKVQALDATGWVQTNSGRKGLSQDAGNVAKSAASDNNSAAATATTQLLRTSAKGIEGRQVRGRAVSIR